ncbi:hypothetical protein JL722_11698 [Aureococcus anophagefferens]|nr:hypothetical protein JL722_11698 [Aureococcus anophagefferens]
MDQGVLRNQCSNYNYDKVWVGAFVDILKKGLGPQDHRAAVRALNAEHREAHEEVEEERARAREEEREAKAERARAREEAKAEREAEKEAKDRAREEAKAEREAADQAEKDRVAAQVILGAMAVSGRSAASIFGEVDEGFAKLVDICDGILRTPRTLFYIYLTAVAEGEDADVAAFEEAKSAARRSTFLLPGVKFLEGNVRAIKVADVAWIARRLEAMGHGHYAALCRNRILWKRRSCGTVAWTGCRYAVCVAWTQRRVGEPRPAGSYSDCLAGIPPLSAAVKRQLEAETIPRLPSVQGPSDITIVLRKTHERGTLCPYSASHYEIKTLGRVVFFIWWYVTRGGDATNHNTQPEAFATGAAARAAARDYAEGKKNQKEDADKNAQYRWKELSPRGGGAKAPARKPKPAPRSAPARAPRAAAKKRRRRSPKKAAAARDAEYAALWTEAKREGGLTANLAAWFGGEANERRRAAKDAETPADARREALEARNTSRRRSGARRAGASADGAATLAAIADASDEPAVVVEEAAGELVAIEGGDQDLDDFDSDGGGAVTPPPPDEPADEPAAEDFLSDVYHDVGGVVVVERAPEPDFSAKNYIFAEDVLITPDSAARPRRGAEEIRLPSLLRQEKVIASPDGLDATMSTTNEAAPGRLDAMFSAQNSTAGSDGLDATMSSTNEAAPGRLDAMFSAQNSTAGRAEGNALFVRGEYANAIAAYDLALGRATDDAEKALLYANRSACQLGLDANAAAAADATKAVKLAPKHAKAWYRLATAELRQRRGAQALRAAKRASALEAGGATRQLLKKCEQLHKTQKPGLYGDKRPAPKKSATALEVERRDGKMALDRLRSLARSAADGEGVAEHGGMMVFFAKLARSAADFREVVFPGAPPSRFEGDGRLPGSLVQFLDDGRFADALERRWPAVLKKAMDVLAGAKRQGEGAGETMDAETERALWPSVVCEAYSREFAAAARDAAARGAAARELDDDFPALAELKRKLDELGAALAAAGRALDGPARACAPLLARATRDEVEPCDRLHPPTEGSMLLQLKPDHDVDDEDFACDGDDAATPARFPLVSCCYFLGNGDARAHLRDENDGGDDDAPHDGGHLILKRAPDGDFSYVDPTPDTLVLWRSKLAYHARAPVRRGSSLAVKHWIFAGADPKRGA